jgi:hypothetical protein
MFGRRNEVEVSIVRLLSSAILLILLSGCGGFRGGIESVPYVGTALPQVSTAHPAWPYEVTLPDLTLRLSLNNAVQTYQYEVTLYVIPIYLNFWDEFRSRHAESLELSLQVTARGGPVTFDPRQLTLTVDGKEIQPKGVWVNNRERERRVIDDFVKARRQAPPNQSPATPHASEWRDEVTDAAALGPLDESPRYIVIFPLPLLSPEKDLTLDINRALLEPKRSPIPAIHFKSMSWSEGYS